MNLLVAVSLLVVFHAFVNELLTVLEHAIDKAGQPVGHGGDCLGGTQFGAQASVLGPQIALAPEQAVGRQAEGQGSTVDHLPSTAAQYPIAARTVVRAKSQP